MKSRINLEDLRIRAANAGLQVQHECGGFRLVNAADGGRADVFPDGGVCAVTTARALSIFLDGMWYERIRRANRRMKG